MLDFWLADLLTLRVHSLEAWREAVSDERVNMVWDFSLVRERLNKQIEITVMF